MRSWGSKAMSEPVASILAMTGTLKSSFYSSMIANNHIAEVEADSAGIS